MLTGRHQPSPLGPHVRAGTRHRAGCTQACRAVNKPRAPQPAAISLQGYELVVVGSGNGACAFITKFLQATQGQEQRRVLVLEEGQDFLQTSFVTHQANWTKSYGEESIYKLHAATTGPNGGNRPIISGRAVTQGGGGSINYTMIHESSDWLAQQLGAGGAYGPDYFDELKKELGLLFQRRDPGPERTPVAQALWEAITNPSPGGGFFQDVPGCSATGWIPQYIDGAAGGALGRVYTFNAQFNDWGQRTNSGASLVAGGRAWRSNSRVELWTNARVEALRFEGSGTGSNGGPAGVPCTGLTIRRLGPRDTVQHITFDPNSTTMVLAAGSSTPRLLLPHREALQNPAIGTRVNDHILLPAGFYGLRQDAAGQPQVSPKDQYLPLFPEQEVTLQVPSAAMGATSSSSGSSDGEHTTQQVTVTVGYDFFAGPVSDLSFFLAHLFVSLWMPNWLKSACLNSPSLFMTLKKFTALLIESGEFIVNLKYGLLTGGKEVPPINVITGTNKFNIFYEGHYEPQPEAPSAASTRIVLKCFADSPDGSRRSSSDAAATPDGRVAVATMAPLMRKLDAVGQRPWGVVQWLLKTLFGLPYDPDSEDDIKAYVRKYAESHLLTEQHMSGGCVLGHAAEDGSKGPGTVGQVKGTSNVIVADLSALPLPRLSPQMTAYLVGLHVATQRYGQQLAEPAARTGTRQEVRAADTAATQVPTAQRQQRRRR